MKLEPILVKRRVKYTFLIVGIILMFMAWWNDLWILLLSIGIGLVLFSLLYLKTKEDKTNNIKPKIYNDSYIY